MELPKNNNFNPWFIGLGIFTFIGILILWILFSPKEMSDEKQIATWGEKVEVTETRQIQYEPATFVSDGKTTYWFVYAKERGKLIYWNAVVKQEHSYFSINEALTQLKKESEGKDMFLLNFQQVAEATYIEYEKIK